MAVSDRSKEIRISFKGDIGVVFIKIGLAVKNLKGNKGIDFREILRTSLSGYQGIRLSTNIVFREGRQIIQDF